MLWVYIYTFYFTELLQTNKTWTTRCFSVALMMAWYQWMEKIVEVTLDGRNGETVISPSLIHQALVSVSQKGWSTSVESVTIHVDKNRVTFRRNFQVQVSFYAREIFTDSVRCISRQCSHQMSEFLWMLSMSSRYLSPLKVSDISQVLLSQLSTD